MKQKLRLWEQSLGVVIFLELLGSMAIAQSLPQQSPPISPSTLLQISDAATPQTVNLTLPQLINIVVQGNRDLRNTTLERMVQRQVLKEAKSKFSPQFTPEASVTLNQNLSGQPLRTVPNSLTISPDDEEFTTDDRSIGVSGTLLTPIGTQISTRINPISEETPFILNIQQPLLRGAGKAVNQASVNQARLIENQNLLALRQTLIDTITITISQYNNLIQSQEAVEIQEKALSRRLRQKQITQALVTSGRRARIDLVNSERSIAEAERQLIEAQNQLNQANTDLRNQIGTDTPWRFAASREAIDELYDDASRRVPSFRLENLIETAYSARPDYLQAQLDIDIEKLNLLLAKDNRRWNLNLESNTSLGDRSDTSIGVVVNRTFGDASSKTELVRRQVGVQQSQNQLEQVRESISNEVTNRLNDVKANQRRFSSSRREVEAAQLQLNAEQEKFQRGIGGTTLNTVIDSEERLVNAQNAQLVAQIAFLNSIANLEQAVGITLETWSEQVDFSNVLQADESIHGINDSSSKP